jgi:hypothetical protein
MTGGIGGIGCCLKVFHDPAGVPSWAGDDATVCILLHTGLSAATRRERESRRAREKRCAMEYYAGCW